MTPPGHCHPDPSPPEKRLRSGWRCHLDDTTKGIAEWL